MSIFKYSSKKPDSDTGNEKDDHPLPAYLPRAFESGLGQQEYQNVVSNVVNPSTVSPATGRQRGKRQSYDHYSGEMRAKIGKYAAENGNEKARKHFSKDFLDLKESTIRNFKKKYYVKLAEARKAGNTGHLYSIRSSWWPTNTHGPRQQIPHISQRYTKQGWSNQPSCSERCYACTYHK